MWRIGRLGGKFVLTFWHEGKRHRYRLNAKDASEANRVAPSIYHELTRPKGKTVAELWHAYVQDRIDRPITLTMAHTWKAIGARFGAINADAITTEDCRIHAQERRSKGIKEWTIITELGHLKTVLKWAEKQRLIAKAPHIERPSKPRSTERHLTRSQARSLRDCASVPHVKLFIVLAQATGARVAALLDLTWDRVDFGYGQIDLRDPNIKTPHKGRAIVPMNRELRAALLEAKQGALSPYVIEWAGKKVKSVKKGLKAAARKAGLGNVHPHMLRRSAAIHMVEAGVPMEAVAQFLGHSNSRTTYERYARFSPSYLRDAAAALEYDDLAEVRRAK